MRILRGIALAALLTLLPGPPAWAGVYVGVGFGGRGYYCHRPYYGYGCYRPWYPGIGVGVVLPIGAPVYAPVYAPVAPVVVQQVPTVVQPVYTAASPPVAQTAPPPLAPTLQTAASPLTPPALTQVGASNTEIDRYIQHLANPDDQARVQAVMQLGRARAAQAVEPLAQVLASDRSPKVREAAARGLGLIGSPASLPALQQAAQADEDREVRASARFAVDVIRSHTP